MLLSVLIPVYNAAPYLGRCLVSLKTQTFRDFEVIIVDDGSTDESYAICKDYASQDNRIKVFHKENGGEATARNAAVANASGIYICWIDADDYVSPQYIESLVASLSTKPDLVMQSHIRKTETEELTVGGASLGYYNLNDKEQQIAFFNSVQLDHFGVSYAKLFLRSIIIDNTIAYSPNIRLAVDLDFLLRYLSYCSTVDVSQSAYYYYMLRSGSVSTKIYDYEVENSGLMQLDSSWYELYNRFQNSQILELRGTEVSAYILRVLISCYKPGVNYKLRIERISSFRSSYYSLYRKYGPNSTSFLTIVRFLFSGKHLRLLDMLFSLVYRSRYPLHR